MHRRQTPALLVLLLVAFSTLAGQRVHAAEPLRIHYPDSGAPPWLFLAPGGDKPTGIVADILDAAARQSGRTLRYEFQPRESASDALLAGSADGALFFSATRPAAAGIATTDMLLKMDSVLVTLKGRAINYERPINLKDQRLCTLTDEIYPPLTLLAMNGNLLQRRAKTEQAQLMMLRNADCVAAIVNGPMYRWLATRYRWEDLRVEPRPLLNETLIIGFAASEAGMVAAVNKHVQKLRASGELDLLVARYLPGGTGIGTR